MFQPQLLNSSIDYQFLFERSNDGILIHDIDRDKTVLVNHKALQLLDRKKEEVMFKSASEYLHDRIPTSDYSMEQLEGLINKIKKAGKGHYERRHLRSNGEIICLSVSGYKMPPPQSHLLVVVYRDITSLKRQEELVNQQNQVLKEKNEELTKYIESNHELEQYGHMTAHELQSPLKTIRSFVKLLDLEISGERYEAIEDHLKYISSASEEMEELIRSLLNYSKIDACKINIQEIDFENLIEKVFFTLEQSIFEKKANIQMETFPRKLFADPIKLRQVFQNLLSNSLKYQSDGNIPEIKINTKETDNLWLFSISDNGIGIPKEHHDRIFESFRRLNNRTKYKGTGLGLSLCKKFIEQHNGQIWVESDFGKGSTFFFTIAKKNYNIPQKEKN